MHRRRVPASPPLAPPLPRFAQIEPAGRCNLACRMGTVHERGDAVAGLSIEQLYVPAAGSLLPCCMVATADRASFGDVFASGSAEDREPARLLERRHGAEAQAFRAALASATPPSVCRSCALYRGSF